jgi:hypothetical protein
MSKTQTEENTSRMSLDSRYMKTLLILVTGVLLFVGPTYVPYAAIHVLKLSFIRAMLGGFIVFLIGLVLLWFIIRRKIIF